MSLSPLRSLRDLLQGGNPHSTCLKVIDDGKVKLALTRHSAIRTIEQLGYQLREYGVRPGDVVSLAMENTAEYVMTFLAVTWVRAVAAPLNPGYKTGEFEFYMEDVKSKLLIVGDAGNVEAEVAAKTLDIPVYTATNFTGDGAQGIRLVLSGPSKHHVVVPASNATYSLEIPQANDIALFLHTSGTTGRPKLVPLTHHNLITSMGNVRNTYELDEKDISYLVMPLFHIHGLVAGLFAPLCAGGIVVLPEKGKFSASVFWNDVVGSNATYYTAVPTMHTILLGRAEEDAAQISRAKLRFIRSCSSPLSPTTFHKLEQRFGAPVLEAYAMSECAHQMSSNPLPKHGPRKPGSVGRAMNVQITIFDDNNQPVKQGQAGHVCVRGENVCQGYLNRPEANRDDFAGGWFHTGDLGFIDSDGYLFLSGRLKEIINRGGEKLSPNEIDNVLLSHPAVQEAVTFGSPSAKYGEEVACAIIPKTNHPLTEQDLKTFCTQKLSKEKIPTRIIITDSIPKTATGKIQRRKVADHFNKTNSKL